MDSLLKHPTTSHPPPRSPEVLWLQQGEESVQAATRFCVQHGLTTLSEASSNAACVIPIRNYLQEKVVEACLQTEAIIEFPIDLELSEGYFIRTNARFLLMLSVVKGVAVRAPFGSVEGSPLRTLFSRFVGASLRFLPTNWQPVSHSSSLPRRSTSSKPPLRQHSKPATWYALCFCTIAWLKF